MIKEVEKITDEVLRSMKTGDIVSCDTYYGTIYALKVPSGWIYNNKTLKTSTMVETPGMDSDTINIIDGVPE